VVHRRRKRHGCHTPVDQREAGAYTLSDTGTFLAHQGNLSLVPLIQGGSDLLNTYTAIAINPKKHPGGVSLLPGCRKLLEDRMLRG